MAVKCKYFFSRIFLQNYCNFGDDDVRIENIQCSVRNYQKTICLWMTKVREYSERKLIMLNLIVLDKVCTRLGYNYDSMVYNFG